MHSVVEITLCDSVIVEEFRSNHVRCDPCWQCDIPVWYFSEKKWRYGSEPTKEVPIWHTVPLPRLERASFHGQHVRLVFPYQIFPQKNSGKLLQLGFYRPNHTDAVPVITGITKTAVMMVVSIALTTISPILLKGKTVGGYLA